MPHKKMSLNNKRTAWWREAIVYQIWPKSFYSGKGTPFGDLEGIIQKLDYIKSLGVNTIWLSPHYASPMVDEGYDISDYENINPIFGTLQDAEKLIKECHDRELGILFDLVITYTSDQHKFFMESRSSKINPKRDWYIWRPAKYDKEGKRQPPTNWIGAFYQSAWEWDEHTQEYYLHHYSIHQPDLNWRNEECRKAIMQTSMIFWLERGVDGFRVDTCTQYSKPKEFFDAPITNPKCRKIIENGKEIHQYLGEMGKFFENYDAMTVGECCNLSTSETLKYVSFARNELSMAFKPKVVCLGLGKVEPRVFEAWTYKQMFKEIEELQTEFEGTDGWSTSFLENHDLGRSVSRFTNHSPAHHTNACKMLSLYTTMLSGTPFIYQGQEIGMKNVPLSWDLSEYLDIATINYVKSLKDANISEEEIEKKYKPDINLLARDNSRTPVQWTDGPNAGFTKENIKPWMRINDDYKEINVASQLDDKDSILNFYRMAIDVRKKYPELFVYGKFSLLLNYDQQDDKMKVLAFSKTARSESSRKAIVLLNFSDHEENLSLEGMEKSKILLSSHNATIPTARLQPFEGRVILL